MEDNTSAYYVIASTGFEDFPLLKKTLRSIPEPSLFVTGGGEGVDILVETYCRETKVPVMIRFVNQERDGKGAVFKRNIHLIEDCSKVIAFSNLDGRGTFMTLEKAILEKRKDAFVEFVGLPEEPAKKAIVGFTDENFWLSNLFPSPISDPKICGGIVFPTVENAFWASKFIGYEGMMEELAAMHPTACEEYAAKFEATTPNWKEREKGCMRMWLEKKFSIPALKKKLDLTEGFNIYNAVQYPRGVWDCEKSGKGANGIGRLIEDIRNTNRNETILNTPSNNESTYQ